MNRGVRRQCLYDCVIVGSHDSGAYVIDRWKFARSAPRVLAARAVAAPLHNVVDAFSRTQSVDVFAQLTAGVRLLDLRVSKLHAKYAQDRRFWIVHGPAACVPLEDILDQINHFHRNQDNAASERGREHTPPLRSVITVVRPLSLSDGEVQELAETIRATLTHELYLGSAAELRSIAIEELPLNIVAGVAGLGELSDYKWAADIWIDTYDIENKVTLLGEEVRQAKPKSERDTLHVLGFTVTPQAYHFALRILSLGLYRNTLLKTATTLSERHLDTFLAQHRERLLQCVNVIFFDAVSAADAQTVHTSLQ